MPSRLTLLSRHAVDVAPMAAELGAHPEVWNTVTLRTEHPKSPHRETDDCWVHYNPIKNYHGDIKAFNEEHVPDWYPAADVLPSVVACAMGLSQGGKLGFVLLTRIPPGAQVYPHTDKGWHAVNHQKFCVSVKANKSQAFCFAGEEMRTEAGDVFTFDNSHPHWVTNESDEERISLIICVRSH